MDKGIDNGSTISTMLAARVATAPESTFVHFGGEAFSYAEIDEQSDRVATGWLRLGLGHGDRIAIAATNSPHWIVAHLAAAKIGAVLVTLNVVYREREFTHMLTQSGARALICDAESNGFEFGPFLDQLRPDIPTVEHLVFLGGDEAPGRRRWADLAATEPEPAMLARAAEAVRPTDPAVILYTSGTTGTPKGATITHASLLASAVAQVERFEQSAADVILGVMPFNHVGGLTCTLGSTLVTGGAIALLPRFHPDLVVDVMADTGVTMFVGVPTMYKMVLGADSFAGMDMSSVRLCVVGGSNLEPALAEQVAARFDGVRIANLYGMSETSGACVISPPGDSLETVGRSIGIMTGDFEGRIVDDRNTPLSPGEVGELQVRGGCVAAGYWQLPDESAATFLADGWLATGDVASMSEDGHVSLLGRRKEMYVRGGYNVYPAEIENVLAADPTVALCAVIGVPDETFGETGYAFVVPAPGAAVDPEWLIERCRRTLAKYKVPDRVEVVDGLPMTPAGKIRKVALTPRT
ncbi:class I adenylate-forming enzyme family protein [Rhodococcus sp. AG1013]|uniref:class I adenylate-forming enzyme family protein n=1 Tax=unclassified Rhodococcus (in: high G+C Gram-positive bacteria) TaxID=192944 RepID=UPI000E09E2EE|nr:class I adenylate-forming enzyme family protein [Rhodococcus sp. AG1013]RDI18035.1 fatty-acyl-CoA synthase [Rhodococcus sp. AG1013]